MLNIFVTNLGKYNEGELVGEWLELPAAKNVVQKTFKNIGLNEAYEEFFISDYDSDIENLEIDEYAAIEELNELADKLKNFDDIEIKILNTLLEYYDGEEVIEKISNNEYAIYSNCANMADVAFEIVEESGILRDVQGDIALYFDYDAYGRDLEINGSFYRMDYNTYVQVL